MPERASAEFVNEKICYSPQRRKKEMELTLQGSRVREYRLTDSRLPHLKKAKNLHKHDLTFFKATYLSPSDEHEA